MALLTKKILQNLWRIQILVEKIKERQEEEEKLPLKTTNVLTKHQMSSCSSKLLRLAIITRKNGFNKKNQLRNDIPYKLLNVTHLIHNWFDFVILLKWHSQVRYFEIAWATKGQLISECPFWNFKFSKNPPKILTDFCPRI